jgi:putative transposase
MNGLRSRELAGAGFDRSYPTLVRVAGSPEIGPPVMRASTILENGSEEHVDVATQAHAGAGRSQAERSRPAAQRGAGAAGGAQHLEIAEATYHRWRNQYGGMKADDVKRLKELEAENQKLKRLVADQTLENAALKEIAKRRMTDERSSPRGFGCRAGGACVALPVGDGSFVGRLGVLGDLALGCSALLAVEGVLTAAGLVAGVSGLELDGADLLGHRGREGVGVVLFADEQVPEQLGHLAGGRDDRDGVPAAGADPLVERA